MKAKTGLAFIMAALGLALSQAAFADGGSCSTSGTSGGNCNYFSSWGYGNACNTWWTQNQSSGCSTKQSSGCSTSSASNSVPAITPTVQITTPAGIAQLSAIPTSTVVTVVYTTPVAVGTTITLLENGILVGTYNVPIFKTSGTINFNISLAGVLATDIIGFQATLTPGTAVSSSYGNSSNGNYCGYGWDEWSNLCWTGGDGCGSGQHYEGDNCGQAGHDCKTGRYGGCYNNYDGRYSNNCGSNNYGCNGGNNYNNYGCNNGGDNYNGCGSNNYGCNGGYNDGEENNYSGGNCSGGGSSVPPTPVAGPVASNITGIYFNIVVVTGK